jgi:hypothetical protein
VDRRAPLASFEQWLWAHTAKVQVSSLTVLRNIDLGLKLPVAQLQRRQDLELQHVEWSPSTESAGTEMQVDASISGGSSSSSSSSLQPLAALTALTRFALTGSSVRLEGLSALTGLQELYCQGGYGRRAESVADLNAAFPQLQRLTTLTLRNHVASTAVVSHISALQSLQRLVLENTSADSFAALPKSLTELNMAFTPRGSLIRSNAAGLSQLTALQSLYLRDVVPLDCALLAGMRNLRSLRLCDCELAAGTLQLVSRLTSLTCLRVWWGGMEPVTFTAAEAAALTASSQLAELDLSGLSGQPQAYASLFPPGRQLQHLILLCVSGDILRDSAAVCLALKCGPNLQSLILLHAKHNGDALLNDDDAAAVVDNLAAMSTWSSLRQLQLFNAWHQLPLAAEQADW